MISARWIKQAETKLACMATGPNRDKLAAEIASAKADRAASVTKLQAAGLKVNTYPGKCVITGAKVEGGEGYVHKNAAGRWDTYSKAGAAERFGV